MNATKLMFIDTDVVFLDDIRFYAVKDGERVDYMGPAYRNRKSELYVVLSINNEPVLHKLTICGTELLAVPASNNTRWPFSWKVSRQIMESR